MKVYAKVSIEGYVGHTEPDLVNNINPEWNKTIKFMVPEMNIIEAQGKISVKIELIRKRSLSPDKYVGEVNLSLDHSQCSKSCNTCLVYRSDSSNYESSSFGTLMYSSVLGEKLIVVDSSPSKDYTDIIAQIGEILLEAVVTGAEALAGN
ncbi:hypothetical protein MTR67_000111 [Solanum verrucosum]|uniref:C2 domain-containing protein n=1 Tax=Solanum verrucosum TaxID=315347 RepID=A0AAF0T681_SOLVR|nr:hypothetical protein MTR67_000111 [Solanum verrucosum]